MAKLLSKSRYLFGLQCKRYLWLLFNEPERVPGPDAAYLTMTYRDMPEEEKAATRVALLKYCGLDTETMVRIIKRLDEISVDTKSSAR
jgi:hypothetical protein